jgi:hypothetical protein
MWIALVKNPSFLAPLAAIAGAPRKRQPLGMRVTSFSVYVQISLFVTKVLIRKRF